MDKIVIKTDSLERSGNLLSCLGTLFPMCTIEIQLVEMVRHEDISRKPESGLPNYGINLFKAGTWLNDELTITFVDM